MSTLSSRPSGIAIAIASYQEVMPMGQGRLFQTLKIVNLMALRVLFFALPSFLGGCAKEDAAKTGHLGWRSLPVAIYADPALVNQSVAQADFGDAMAFWEAKAGRKIFDYKGVWQGQTPPYTGTANQPGTILGNVLFLQNPWPFGAQVAGETVSVSTSDQIDASMIMLNPNIAFCSANCSGEMAETSLRKTIAHELGHFLGLTHVTDTKNIMYPNVQPGGSLADVEVDTQALLRLTQ